MLDRLLSEYNKTFHNTISMEPIKASKIKNYELKALTKQLGKP
jgi:hypothetical protein